MGKHSPAERVKELEREIGQRKYVYPKLVLMGKMSQREMDRRISLLQEMADEEKARILPEPQQADLLGS